MLSAEEITGLAALVGQQALAIKGLTAQLRSALDTIDTLQAEVLQLRNPPSGGPHGQ